jgi:triosephosphate isomerase
MAKLIVANWKMNPATLKEAKKLFSASVRAAQKAKRTEVVVCPPHIWLVALPKRRKAPWLGAQDLFWEAKTGPFTGEVSAAMLKEAGCRYVIIGHSERKRYLGETDNMINRKVLAALGTGFKVVLCIGENSRAGTQLKVVDKIIEDQLLGALEKVPAGKILDIIVAYEPVWAISTTEKSHAATPDDALQASLLIRKLVGRKYSRKQADKLKVIYGGSVDSKNVGEFVAEDGIDGVLPGGASINAKEFTALLRAV